MSGEESEHLSLADAMACGLSAVLLLFFAVLINQAVGTSHNAALSVVSVAFDFDMPIEALRLTCNMDSRPLLTLEPTGEISLGSYFEQPPQNLFTGAVRAQSNPKRAGLGISLSAGGLRAIDKKRVKRWTCDIAVRFSGKPREVDVEWLFRSGKGPKGQMISLPKGVSVHVENNFSRAAPEKASPACSIPTGEFARIAFSFGTAERFDSKRISITTGGSHEQD